MRLLLALFGVLTLLVTGCGSTHRASTKQRQHGPSLPTRYPVASARLYPAPKWVTVTCKQTADHFKIRVLCPAVLPRASLDQGDLPPPKVQLLVIRGGGYFGGFSFLYGAPLPTPKGYSPARDSPASFLHFEVDPANNGYYGGLNVRQDARHVRLGGRVGWLRPADARGPFFGGHVRFYFKFAGHTWAATLHNYGTGTTALLDRIITRLRTVAPS